MSNNDQEQKKTGVARGASPWVLLDKRGLVSNNPDAYNTTHQRNNNCIEIYHGLNVVKEQWAGISFATFILLVFFSFLVNGEGLDYLLIASPAFVLTIGFLLWTKNKFSNIRLNQKTQKLYAMDKKSKKLIEMDWADIEVRQFTNVRLSGRGASTDYNLDFHGKDKHSGFKISMTTPMIYNEEDSLANWEYFRQFMNNDLKVEPQVPPIKTFGNVLKERLKATKFAWGPLKSVIKSLPEDLKKFKIFHFLFGLLVTFVFSIGVVAGILGIPGVVLETWADFYWRKQPKFPKEIDELCGFSEK